MYILFDCLDLLTHGLEQLLGAVSGSLFDQLCCMYSFFCIDFSLISIT